MNDITYITTPIGGRMVSGDAYTPRTTDSNGQPLIIKNGPNAGQPRQEYSVGIAIPKAGSARWQDTPWGQSIMKVARDSFPSMFDPATGELQPGREFSFKVLDGDSQQYNKNGNRNCDKEGYPGNWVLFFSNGGAPRCVSDNGATVLTDPIIKRGHYVQVHGSVKGNGSAQSPGVYLNLSIICWDAYGPEITTTLDATQVGFGQGALPQTASATPVSTGTGFNPAQPAPAHDLVNPATVGAAVPPPPPPAPAPVAEESYLVNGQPYTKSQLLAMPGWTEAHLAGLQKV